MIYLNKLLPYLLYPITIIIVLLIWSVITKKRLPAVIALIILIFTSSPIVSHQIVSYVDGKERKKIIEEMSVADSIVVLSGMLKPVMTKQGVASEWDDPDRFFAGIELIKAGKAKNIIFTGGVMPWQENTQPEGLVLAKFAENFGVPSSQIIVTKDVQNTSDESKAVREILSKSNTNKIILVTSAFHMSRAANLFEKKGIEVQTFPVDYKAGVGKITSMSFLPSADAFYAFQFALRELIGRAYYSFITYD
jgi:uncharacterized SAM-binding protein YcdF (DUF218 family)